jgi:hypothetical protein
MKKIILILTLLLNVNLIFAQNHEERKYYYHENGQLKTIAKTINGIREIKRYYENGNLESDEKIDGNGEQTGEWKFYYENGQLSMIGSYLDGKQHGKWKFYKETGELKATEYYINDKRQPSSFSSNLNLHSHTKTKWEEVNKEKNIREFTLDESNHIKYNNQPFKGDLSNIEAPYNPSISPTSQNNKYAAIDIDESLFICDLDRLISYKLDIYYPFRWLSWSPTTDFALFAQSYEGSSSLYSYNLKTNQLTELNFNSEFNNETEVIEFNVDNILWFSINSFEVPISVKCNRYSDDCIDDGKILRSYIYTYDVVQNLIKKRKKQ